MRVVYPVVDWNLYLSPYLYLAILPLGLFSIASVVFAIIYKFYLNSHRGNVQVEVTLVMAMTGASEGFKSFLSQLNRQLLTPTRLVISVESVVDPAYATIQKYASQARFPIEIIIAGLASISSQKSHNVVAALNWLNQNGDLNTCVVLCDADIKPPVWWLSALVKPLVNQQADVVTGYRWQQAQNNGLGSNLVTFLDRKIAVLPRPLSADLIWGGSVAMTQAVVQSVLQSGILLDTLSDDLTLASYAAKKNFRVLSRRLLLVPSRAPETSMQAWAFVVRQYKIIKVYRPVLWHAAFLVAALKVVGWMVLLYFASSSLLPFVFTLLLLVLTVTQVRIEKSIAEHLGFVEPSKCWRNQYLLAIAKPCVDFWHCALISLSTYTHQIRWGHVMYKVDSPHHVIASHALGLSGSTVRQTRS